VKAAMVWSRKFFSVNREVRFVESISGDRNSLTSSSISSILSQAESVRLFIVVYLSGLIPAVLISYTCPLI